jgi:hypothetical protein
MSKSCSKGAFHCMKIKNFVIPVISFSLLVILACGKEDPKKAQEDAKKAQEDAKKAQVESLQGTWVQTQLSSFVTITTIDPALAEVSVYTGNTGSFTKKLSLTCSFSVDVNVSHPSSTSYSLDSITDIRFVESSGCQSFGVTSASLAEGRARFRPQVYSYTLNGNTLDVKQDETCRRADGTSDFEHKIFTRL